MGKNNYKIQPYETNEAFRGNHWFTVIIYVICREKRNHPNSNVFIVCQKPICSMQTLFQFLFL